MTKSSRFFFFRSVLIWKKNIRRLATNPELLRFWRKSRPFWQFFQSQHARSAEHSNRQPPDTNNWKKKRNPLMKFIGVSESVPLVEMFLLLVIYWSWSCMIQKYYKKKKLLDLVYVYVVWYTFLISIHSVLVYSRILLKKKKKLLYYILYIVYI